MAGLLAGLGKTLLSGVAGGLVSPLVNAVSNVAGNVVRAGTNIVGKIPIIGNLVKPSQPQPPPAQQVQPQYQPPMNFGIADQVSNFSQQFNQKLRDGFNMYNQGVQQVRDFRDQMRNGPSMGDRVRGEWNNFKQGMKNEWNAVRDEGRRAWGEMRDMGRDAYRQTRDMGRQMYNEARDMGREMYRQGRDMYRQGRDMARDEYRRSRDAVNHSYQEARAMGRQMRRDWQSFR